MYNWRKLTPDQRELVISERQRRRYPWHRPPHFSGTGRYLVSAACYEHRHYIGITADRMLEFEHALLTLILGQPENLMFAWCILPNHYHILVYTKAIKQLTREIGRFHGRISHQWNGEENCRGRKVWHACSDRAMRSEDHFWATMNYVHHNPVKHGYVAKWQDWPYSSASSFLKEYQGGEAIRIWKEYPLDDYGRGWDDPDM